VAFLLLLFFTLVGILLIDAENARTEKRPESTAKKEEKPLHFKDYVREVLIKEGSEGLLESDEEEDGNSSSKRPAKVSLHTPSRAPLLLWPLTQRNGDNACFAAHRI